MAIKILIADDHALVRDGIRLNLEINAEFKVIGTAANGREAIDKANTLRPDMIIMDIAMPELNGIEATRLICQSLPEVKILILSMYYTIEHTFRAVQAGAKGYILKESAGDEVVNAVLALAKGRFFFGAGVADPFANVENKHHTPTKSPIDRLSFREREVLQLVVEGKSSAEVAAQLFLSPKSVDTYRSRLMQKLGVSNISSLVSFALQHGIIPPR